MNLETALADLFEPAPPGFADRVAAALELGDQYVTVPGPSGPLWIAFGRRGVSFVYAGEDDERAIAAYTARYPNRPLRAGAPGSAGTLAAAVEGTTAARRLTYDLSSCTPFQRAVLEKTAEIPRGEVRSYGWVARQIGHASAVRAVGTALGRNPVPVLIPCHRVVRSDGRIGNYALGPEAKQRLLTTEGVDLDRLAERARRGSRPTPFTPSSTA